MIINIPYGTEFIFHKQYYYHIYQNFIGLFPPLKKIFHTTVTMNRIKSKGDL